MTNNIRPSDAAKAGLSVTILVALMLLPVLIIAWAAKWIYRSRR